MTSSQLVTSCDIGDSTIFLYSVLLYVKHERVFKGKCRVLKINIALLSENRKKKSPKVMNAKKYKLKIQNND